MSAFDLLLENNYPEVLELACGALIDAVDAFYDDPTGYLGGTQYLVDAQKELARLEKICTSLDLTWESIIKENVSSFELERMQNILEENQNG